MKAAAITTLLVFGFFSLAFAHPPKSIEVKVATNTVDVTVEHIVANPIVHYIVRIEVKVNGAVVIEQKFSSQNDDQKQLVMYYIPGLKKDDKIEVAAYCIKGGDLTKQVIVE